MSGSHQRAPQPGNAVPGPSPRLSGGHAAIKAELDSGMSFKLPWVGTTAVKSQTVALFVSVVAMTAENFWDPSLLPAGTGVMPTLEKLALGRALSPYFCMSALIHTLQGCRRSQQGLAHLSARWLTLLKLLDSLRCWDYKTHSHALRAALEDQRAGLSWARASTLELAGAPHADWASVAHSCMMQACLVELDPPLQACFCNLPRASLC